MRTALETVNFIFTLNSSCLQRFSFVGEFELEEVSVTPDNDITEKKCSTAFFRGWLAGMALSIL